MFQISKQIYLLGLLFVILAQHTIAAEQGILWKIQRQDQAPSYLLGTIHSDDPRILMVSGTIDEIFNRSKSFTAEIKMDLDILLQAQQNMLYGPDKSLPEVIGDARYQKCVQYMREYGIPESGLRRMKAWAVAAQLSLPKPTTGIFLDLLLYQKAVAQGKAVFGLETVEEQSAVFDTLSEQQQITMLDEALEFYPMLNDMVNKLINLYLDRNLEGMQRYYEELMEKGDRALAAIVNQNLLVARNKRMVERMQTRLREGQAFIAVGALHLPGEDGILLQLKKLGYRVTVVY